MKIRAIHEITYVNDGKSAVAKPGSEFEIGADIARGLVERRAAEFVDAKDQAKAKADSKTTKAERDAAAKEAAEREAAEKAAAEQEAARQAAAEQEAAKQAAAAGKKTATV